MMKAKEFGKKFDNGEDNRISDTIESGWVLTLP
jgi:hypothetical protein